MQRRHYLHSQTFSALYLGVLFLEKRTKYNTPSIENCICYLTSDEVGPLLSINTNNQVLSNYEGINLKKLNQLEAGSMIQVA